jgi:hypothetical protein
MSRVLNTETIRAMERDELEGELTTLGAAFNDDYTDDNLRDVLMIKLSEQGDPDDARGDFLYDQQKDDEMMRGRL